jgi:hypothetical protein
MFDYSIKRALNVNTVLCAECHDKPVVVLYDLMGGPDRKVYGYCLECARDLNMIKSSGEASAHLQVNPRTVRSWCTEWRLESFKDEAGHWWVVFDPHRGTPIGDATLN